LPIPDAFITNSVEDSFSGAMVPFAMAFAFALLKRWTYSLKEAISSSFEIDAAGVNNPDPLKAIAVTGRHIL
jgi:uncharacterized protein (DUF697 family)